MTKKVKDFKYRETQTSVTLKLMLQLKEGESFYIECADRQITAYSFKHGVKVKLSQRIVTNPLDLSQTKAYLVTVIKAKEEKTVAPPEPPKKWEELYKEIPDTETGTKLKAILKTYYEKL